MSILDTSLQDTLIQIRDHYDVTCMCHIDVCDDCGISRFRDVQLWSETNRYSLRTQIEWKIISTINELCIDKVWRFKRYSYIKKQIAAALRSTYHVTFSCSSRSSLLDRWDHWDTIVVNAFYNNELIATVQLKRTAASYEETDPF